MSITSTTLSTAVDIRQNIFGVASATGITAPNFQTSVGITYLQVDQELMLVVSLSGTVVTVARGVLGTAQAAHASGALVQAGLPSDFTSQTEVSQATATGIETFASRIQQAVFLTGSADAVAFATPGYYVVKTAGVDAMTLATPTAAAEGNIIEIWSDTANAHTVTCPTTNFAIGAAANKTVATFPARPGAGIAVRVCNLNYHLMYTSGTGTNSGPIVWT